MYQRIASASALLTALMLSSGCQCHHCQTTETHHAMAGCTGCSSSYAMTYPDAYSYTNTYSSNTPSTYSTYPPYTANNEAYQNTGGNGVYMGSNNIGSNSSDVMLSSNRGNQHAGQGLSFQGQQILNELHHINYEEIQFGQLAMTKGNSEDVRKFGERLVRDHQKNDRQLIDIARAHNFNLVTPRLDEKEQDLENRLQSANGSDFDDQFNQAMKKDHAKAVQKVETKISVGNNDDVRSFLNETLPVLKSHEQIAKNLSENRSQNQDQIQDQNPNPGQNKAQNP